VIADPGSEALRRHARSAYGVTLPAVGDSPIMPIGCLPHPEVKPSDLM
jgi:hypothetical protein